ncbi:MAG: hypothetical protein NTW03_08395 [Verrucomicrobia bacterium]|nr:hypothetical protein [Verrucomicrobiota bacterium]
MLVLAALLVRWRLKWILTTGLVFGVLRYVFCALNGKGWLLAGVALHGASYTLFFITAQIYVNDRVDPAWRTRAQVGNLVGYLACAAWFRACALPTGTQWPLFWGGLTAAVAVVLVYFLAAYQGIGTGLAPAKATQPGPTGTTPL